MSEQRPSWHTRTRSWRLGLGVNIAPDNFCSSAPNGVLEYIQAKLNERQIALLTTATQEGVLGQELQEETPDVPGSLYNQAVAVLRTISGL